MSDAAPTPRRQSARIRKRETLLDDPPIPNDDIVFVDLPRSTPSPEPRRSARITSVFTKWRVIAALLIGVPLLYLASRVPMVSSVLLL